jgi:hypothetical protein
MAPKTRQEMCDRYFPKLVFLSQNLYVLLTLNSIFSFVCSCAQSPRRPDNAPSLESLRSREMWAKPSRSDHWGQGRGTGGLPMDRQNRANK